jgi:sphingomyelin phosphodiesterase
MRVAAPVLVFALLLCEALVLPSTAGTMTEPSPTAAHPSTRVASTSPRSALECDACERAVQDALQPLENNATVEAVSAAVVAICDALHLHNVDHTVCEGIVHEFRGEFFGVLSRTYLSPRALCGFASLCADWTPPPRNWTVAVPGGKPPLLRWPSPSAQRRASHVRFAHFTDLHYDPQYRAGLSAQCGQPLCCRPPAAVATSPSLAAGYWGDSRCDTPLPTVHSMLSDAAARNLSFVLWTGDSPPHNIWNQTRQDQVGLCVPAMSVYGVE